MESADFFLERRRGLRCPVKIILLADWSQYLSEILQTSLTVKGSENLVKSGCFEKGCDGEHQSFFKMKEGYKVSCVTILIFYWITRRLLNLFKILHASSTVKTSKNVVRGVSCLA